MSKGPNSGKNRQFLRAVLGSKRRLKFHFRRICHRAFGLADSLEFCRAKPHRAGEKHGGETLPRGIIARRNSVECAAGSGEFILRIGQFALQRLEVGTGFEIGIGLCQGKQLAQSPAQHRFGSWIAGPAGFGLIARGDHRIEGFLLVGGVTLHCRDQIGDKIVPLAQLRINIGGSLIDRLAQADKPVINPDQHKANDQQGGKDDECGSHFSWNPFQYIQGLSQPRRRASRVIVRPDPDALMAGELGAWLGQQDGARSDAKAKMRKRQTLAVAGAAGVAILIVLFSGDIATAFQIGFFAGAGGLAWAAMAAKPVVDSVKGGINGAIARALDMNYALSAQPGPEFETAKAFEMLPHYERSSFQDLWSGQIDDQSFQLYEADLEVERSTGKSRTWVTVFAGSIITLGFARRFNGVTLIERAGRRKKLFGLLGDSDEITLDGRLLGRVDMVDPQFEDEFAVWSNDQVEARYLVHPEYIERLKAVEQAFAGDKIRALFSEGQLLILLESGNLFESGSLEASDDRRLLELTIDQFGTLAELAARLNERPRG